MVVDMRIIKTYKGYHVTDESKVANIIKHNFSWKPNEKHWLGSGAYFFLDLALAEHWYQNLPTGYGKIAIPAYLNVTVLVNSEALTDMRFLNDYNMVKQEFAYFWETIGENLYTNQYLEFSTYSKEEKKDFYWKLRAAFFDWYKEVNNIDCIIANFNERSNLSNNTDYGNIFSKLKIPYIETQMCVSNPSIIVNIATVKDRR